MNISEYETRQAIAASRVAALVAKFPQLVPCANASGVVVAAKNIRVELKAAFPGIKFSVTTSKFSMGNSLSVRWTDGPSEVQVEAITDKYRAGSFDGMTDCYNYDSSDWKNAFGDAKYLHVSRSHSDAIVARVLARVCAQYDVVEVPSVATLRRGDLRSLNGVSDFDREVWRAVEKHTFCVTAKTLTVPNQTPAPILVAGAGTH